MTTALSFLAIISAGLAFYRPTILSCFAASLLNGMAVYAWWAPGL